MSEDGSASRPAPWAAPGHERRGTGSTPGPAPDSNPPTTPQPPADVSPAPFAVTERHRERVFAGPGYSSPAYRNDRIAVLAVVLGIVGIPVPGVCLVAIACGHLARHRLRTSYQGGRGLAVAGLVLGYVMAAVWLAILLLQLISNAA